MMEFRYWVFIAIVAASFLVGGTSAWYVQGLRGDSKVSKLQKERADLAAAQSNAALTELNELAENINSKAKAATVSVANIDRALKKLNLEFKNAKPLPADCRPDDFRLRHLESAIEEVRKAVAGSDAGGTVPDTKRPR